MNILLITPNFFDYPQQFVSELSEMGHCVDWYDDRPSANSLVKAIIRVNKKIINTLIKKYSKKIIKETSKKQYDKVIVVSGQSFSFDENMLIELKNQQKYAEFVLYQWDSEKNFPYIVGLQKHFHRCYSFDRMDVEKNTTLRFLPLFYCKKYENIGNQHNIQYKYDALFVGTAHPKKYMFINEMSMKLKRVYDKQFIFFFLPSKIVYFYRKVRNSEYKHAKISDFHFKPIKGDEIDKLLYESKCVLDSAQADQSGLTIRIIETLGAKRKLITTNSDVVNYDFYREENIYVYDGGDFDYNSPFFTNEYTEIDEDIYKKYSLRSWLTTLLEIGE